MLAWLLVLALLAGCSGGTSDGGEIGGGGGLPGGSGGGDPPPDPDPDPDPDPGPTPVPSVEAMIEWSAAAGPVAGYHVFVSRDGGAYALEGDATEARTIVMGMAGEVIRVQVAAYDAFGNSGPPSQPSEPFVFSGTTTAASAAAPSEGEEESLPAAVADAGSAGGSGATGGSSSGSGDLADAGEAADSGSESSEPALTGARADFDGDGAADLVWQSLDGSLLRVTSADLSRARLHSLPAGAWRLAALGDFDADGVSDLLFAAPGELALARGTALRAGPGELVLEPWAHLPAAAELVASGDFDADGGADALVQDAGALSLWLAGGDVLPLPALPDGARVAGAGDADGNGHDDLLLSADAGLTLWQLVAGVFGGSSAVEPAAGERVGFADFDGDGADELALRGADSLTFQRALAPFETWQESAPAGASLVGCADYDGDGARDRLWQDAESLRMVGAAGEQVVALDPASPWRLFSHCD
jgi:hypothetical protein